MGSMGRNFKSKGSFFFSSREKNVSRLGACAFSGRPTGKVNVAPCDFGTRDWPMCCPVRMCD